MIKMISLSVVFVWQMSQSSSILWTLQNRVSFLTVICSNNSRLQWQRLSAVPVLLCSLWAGNTELGSKKLSFVSYFNLELCVFRLLVMTISCQTKHALIISFKSLTCHYLHFVRPQSGAETVSMTLLSLDELQGFMQQLQNLPCVVREAELVQVSLAQALKRLVCGLGDKEKEQPKEYSSVTLNYKNKDQFKFSASVVQV